MPKVAMPNVFVKGGTPRSKDMPLNTKLMAHDAKLAETLPVREKGPCFRRIHKDAFQAAIRSEGPEVASAKAEGYWQDMDKRYPWLKGRRYSGESTVFSGFGEGHCRNALNPTGKQRIA